MQHLAAKPEKKEYKKPFGMNFASEIYAVRVSLRSGKVFEIITEAILIWGRLIKEHGLKTWILFPLAVCCASH